MARLIARLVGLIGAAALATAAPAQPRTAAPPATVQQSAAAAAGTSCVLGTTMYDLGQTSQLVLQQPIHWGEFHLANGGPFNTRPLSPPGVIDLAWGPDFKLYGVTNSMASGADANALFRIDPATGSATRIGDTGLQLQDGDLATDPKTGKIYGADGQRLFAFNGLTTTASSAAAQVIWSVPLPGPGWEIQGLAFDPASTLYALIQTAGATGPSARLLKLNLSNQTVSGINLSKRFRSYGGLEFVGNRLYFAEGFRPANFMHTADDKIYEINLTTGAATSSDYISYFNGLASLVTCRPQLQICRPPPPDMTAWYAMDGNAQDRILGNHASPTGSVHFATGWVSGAVSLYTGYLTIPAGPVLNQGLGDFSIEAWIVILPETLTAGVRTILDKRAYVNGGLRGWALIEYNGRLGLQLADGDHSNFYDTVPMATGYRHIAVTVDRDSPQGVRFYVDGVLRAQFDPTARQGNLDNDAPTYIGRHAFQTASEKWIRLDELQFFDRSVTPGEIAETFDAGRAGNCKI